MCIIYQITKLSILLFTLDVSLGADFFEAGFVRLDCYGQEQPGCNSSFPEAHPELAWSYLNATETNTYVYLFTTKNPHVPEKWHICGGRSPPNTNFDPSDRSMFIMPGFFSGICNFAIYREIKNEWMKRGDYNIFLVDWMWGNQLDLIVAFKNLKEIVAKQIAIVVNHLKEDYGVPVEDISCMGHSYGAHLCGFVSQLTRIGVIDGVEPSGVDTAESDPLDDRLDRDDAHCVQVLHGNAGQCLPLYFGVNFTCGTVDFWINDGLHQPPCYINTLQAFIRGDWYFGLINLYPAVCYHFQPLQHYKASINPSDCEFVGVKCDSYLNFKLGQCRQCNDDGENCAIMGADGCDCLTANQLEDGNKNDVNYQVVTNATCPYCENKGINVNGKSCSLPEKQE